MNFNLKEKFFTKIAVAVSVGILSAAGCPAGAAGMQTAGFDAAVQEPVRFEGVVIDENRIPLAGACVAVADDLSVGTIADAWDGPGGFLYRVQRRIGGGRGPGIYGDPAYS